MKISSRELVLLGTFGILILVPILQYERWGIDHLYNNKRLLQIGLLFVGGLIVLFSKEARNGVSDLVHKFSSKVKISLFAVILLGGISTLLSDLKTWAFLDYGHYLLLIVTTFVVASAAYYDQKTALIYLKIAVLGFASFYLIRVSVFYGLYLLGEVPLWPGDLNNKALFSFSNTRFFNQTQTWTIPILSTLGWFYWKYRPQNLKKWGLTLLIIGWGILVFASGARGTILGVVIGIIFIWIYLIKEKWKFFLYHLFLTLFVYLGYTVLFNLGDQSKETVLRTNNLRSYWFETIEKILQEPLLGYGPMHYASIFLNNPPAHPHNWFLQFGFEWGLIVAFILLFLAVRGIKIFSNHLKKEKRSYADKVSYWLKIGLLWSLISGLVHAFFSGLVVMPLSQVWMIFVIGISIGIFFDNGYKYSISSNKSHLNLNKIAIVLTLIAFAGYINWGIQHPIDRKETDLKFYEWSTSSRSYPRFWQQGKIGFEELYRTEFNQTEKSNL